MEITATPIDLIETLELSTRDALALYVHSITCEPAMAIRSQNADLIATIDDCVALLDRSATIIGGRKHD
jgi:hypothetical protein